MIRCFVFFLFLLSIKAVIINFNRSIVISNSTVIYSQPYFSEIINEEYIKSHKLMTESTSSSVSFLSNTHNDILSLIPPRPPRKLYDVFGYNGEISLVMWRLNNLGSIVSTFIVVEGDHTYQGKPKQTKLTPAIKEQIASTGKHVVYITAKLYPRLDNYTDDERWQLAKENEMRQRSAAVSFLLQDSQNADDMVLLGDVDELPDPLFLKQWQTFLSVSKLRTKMFYYSFECVNRFYWDAQAITSIFDIQQTLHKSKSGKVMYILQRSILKKINYTYPSLTGLTEQDIPLSITRFSPRIYYPMYYLAPNGRQDVGWHCSYCMSPTDIQNKLKSFTHVEYSGDQYTQLSNIYDAILNCRDLFGRSNGTAFVRRPEHWDIPVNSDTIEQSTPESVKQYMDTIITTN